jgi:serine/threonine-protein kinase
VEVAGRRVGKYTLERPIGRGGMGEVYLATWSGPDGLARQVAVKLVQPTLIASERGRDLFLQEARALAELSHRNIVEVIELGVDGEDLYLVMEYLDGVDLGRLMRAGALPWPVAVYALAEAARGLAAAHARRIVHGDVSPSNIFLCTDGAVKLVDFGLARPAGPRSERSPRERGAGSSRMTPWVPVIGEGGGVRGKLPYLPPEVLLGAAADALTDIYGLGAVLHECLTGQPLFRAGNGPEIVWRALRDPVPAPSEMAEVPRVLDRLVAGAMARDQSARTRSASALSEQLDAALARWLPARIAALPPEPTPGPPTDTPRRAARWLERLRRRVGR